MRSWILALPPLLGVASRAETVRLHGAASVIESVVQPHKAEVERATGLTLAVDKSNAGKGLKDLIEGKCDASLASASVEATLTAAKAAGLDRPAPDLRMHVVKTSEVVFVVHPLNPVKALTWEQLKDIHTGKITSWKEVGGNDEPIQVYTDATASATRGLVQQVVLGGAAYAPAAKAVGFVKEVATDVANDPRGIGALGREFVGGTAVRVVETKKLERPLAFVTVGEPSANVRKVIEAYRTASRDTK